MGYLGLICLSYWLISSSSRRLRSGDGVTSVFEAFLCLMDIFLDSYGTCFTNPGLRTRPASIMVEVGSGRASGELVAGGPFTNIGELSVYSLDAAF